MNKEKARGGKGRAVMTVIVVFLGIAGLCLLLYPTVADYINSLGYRRAIADYRTSVSMLDRESYEKYLVDAREYNKRLVETQPYISKLPEDLHEEYMRMLDVNGSGIIGYIEIEKVNIYLPIYHGTSEEVLRAGVGHFEGSSLPVDGESVHTVLSGHSGLPSAKLFTNIDQLVVGDTFTVHVLNEDYKFEVESTEVVLPEEIENLHIDSGRDLCTLTTCTPYGVNTHRLVVVGHLLEPVNNDSVDTGDDMHYNTGEQTDDEDDDLHGLQLLIIPGIIVGGVAVVAVSVLIYRRIRKKKEQ